MARTIRRTRGNRQQLTNLVEIETARGGVILEWQQIAEQDPAYGKAYWRYHKDGHSGIYGVPRWYRRELNRAFSRKEKQALDQALKRIDQEVVLSPRKKDAGYFWW